MIQVRLEPRADTPAWLGIALPVLAIIAALALCSTLIVLAGADVVDAYRALFTGAVGSRFNLVETVVKAADAGWRIGEVPVDYHLRRGRSKVTGTPRGVVQAVRDMTAALTRPVG